jgi:hypothetical protein
MVFDPTKGAARESLDSEKAEEFNKAGVLIPDDRRYRSLFFDGRFLTAKDLSREQNYVLTRQADLCRAGGVGVVSGLRVSQDQSEGKLDGSLRISQGHGVTPAGELVVLMNDVRNLRLDDIPDIERLDLAFNISKIPKTSARTLDGLYILAIRPVEYTANPIAAYPTSIGGARSSQDGDIIEAVVITLIPYADQASELSLDARRARAAHDIFIRKTVLRVPVDALPLAILALDGGVLRWVDEYLIRREVGSEQSDYLGFGFAPQAIREAQLLQYQRHLSDVLATKSRSAERFAASEQFFVLPPVGPMPVAGVDGQNLTEVYFPAEVDVELSIIPEDELGVLIEESLFLPPIDLTLPGEEQASTSVVVLLPIPREKLGETLSALLPSYQAQTLRLRSVAPGDSLRMMLAKGQLFTSTSVLDRLRESAWTKALAMALESQNGGSDAVVWYVRRRNFPYKPDVLGRRRFEKDESSEFTTFLSEFGLKDEFETLNSRASALAIGELHTAWTNWMKLSPNDGELLAELVAVLLQMPHVDATAVRVVVEKYNQTDRGSGLVALKSHHVGGEYGNGVPTALLLKFIRTGMLVELDQWIISMMRMVSDRSVNLRRDRYRKCHQILVNIQEHTGAELVAGFQEIKQSLV